jgi:hypothetical protein
MNTNLSKIILTIANLREWAYVHVRRRWRGQKAFQRRMPPPTNKNLVGPSPRLSSGGEFIQLWGSEGVLPGQFASPRGIAVDANDNIYVVDSGNNRIQIFDTDGRFVRSWQYPNVVDAFGIDVDSSGNIYICDGEASQVLKFANDGSFLVSWGEYGWGEGYFRGPRDASQLMKTRTCMLLTT